MKPGEQFTYTARIKNEAGRTITLTRTERPYVYGLCDAYNGARTSFAVEWYVADNGELRLRGTEERTL